MLERVFEVFAQAERSLDRAARQLGRDLRIPGFRKGKVPTPVVIQRIGRDAVLDEAVRSVGGDSGTLLAWEPSPRVRVDHALMAGQPIPPHYDSMVGKLIAYGDTREQALARMQTALAETVIEGINTNIPLHRELMVDAKFMAGGTNIHYLEHWLSQHKR